MKDQVTNIGGHWLWNGRTHFNIDGRAVTPAQLVWSHYHRDTYQKGVPVFPGCGYVSCITPEHLHTSIIAARFNSKGE